ncbi:unnamed protein product, partial [Rotaria sp. Silwood2]
IPGHDNNVANTLSLWSAKARGEYDFQLFSTGDNVHGVAEESLTEDITRLDEEKILRLNQEYFLLSVSVSLKDIIRRFKHSKSFSNYPHRHTSSMKYF